MSFKALAWVAERKGLTKAQKLTLFALADHANKEGRNAYPSVRTIGEEAGVHERTAQLALRDLETMGLIIAEPGGGRGRTTRYALRTDLENDDTGVNGVTVPGLKGGIASEKGGLKGGAVPGFPNGKGGILSTKGGAVPLKGGAMPPEPGLNQVRTFGTFGTGADAPSNAHDGLDFPAAVRLLMDRNGWDEPTAEEQIEGWEELVGLTLLQAILSEDARTYPHPITPWWIAGRIEDRRGPRIASLAMKGLAREVMQICPKELLQRSRQFGHASVFSYVLVLKHYWTEGPLPKSDRRLAVIAEMSEEDWTAGIGPIVRQQLVADADGLHFPVVSWDELQARYPEVDEDGDEEADEAPVNPMAIMTGSPTAGIRH